VEALKNLLERDPIRIVFCATSAQLSQLLASQTQIARVLLLDRFSISRLHPPAGSGAM
jgi:hypothetical protein